MRSYRSQQNFFIMFKFRFITNKQRCSKTNSYVILGQKAIWCDEGKFIYLDAPVLLLRIQDNYAETDDYNIKETTELGKRPFRSNREIWGEIARTNQYRFDKITLYRVNGVNLVPVYIWQSF